MGKKTYNIVRKCKVTGCVLKYECKGFCHLHYTRWKRGIIDIDGKPLRELKQRRPINLALRSTLRLVRQAGINAQDIQRMTDDGDPQLNKPVNTRLIDINQSTAGQESKLVEQNFIFSNIHLLEPNTIQMVIKGAPTAPVRVLKVQDKARIAWHLLRGAKSEKVAEMFPAYSLNQVRRVAQQMRDGTLPVPPEVIKDRKA